MGKFDTITLECYFTVRDVCLRFCCKLEALGIQIFSVPRISSVSQIRRIRSTDYKYAYISNLYILIDSN